MTLSVKINKSGTITIKLDKASLLYAAQYHPNLEYYDDELDDFTYPKFSDSNEFVKEVYRTLLTEEEDGTTMVHRMFDNAILEAVEQGAEGIILKDTE